MCHIYIYAVWNGICNILCLHIHQRYEKNYFISIIVAMASFGATENDSVIKLFTVSVFTCLQGDYSIYSE